MDHATLAIFVMLNNWFHDFSVAMLACGLICLHIIHRRVSEPANMAWLPFARSLAASFNKIVYVCWAALIVLGIVRTLAYRSFEWDEAAGSGQITALVLKHLLLVSLVLWGTVSQLRLRRLLREGKP